MTRFEIGIPIEDSNNNSPDTTSLQSAMELIASDAQTHSIGQDTLFKAGSFITQLNMYFWFIPDTDVSQATSNFNTFISNNTFNTSPYTHNWTVN